MTLLPEISKIFRKLTLIFDLSHTSRLSMFQCRWLYGRKTVVRHHTYKKHDQCLEAADVHEGDFCHPHVFKKNALVANNKPVRMAPVTPLVAQPQQPLQQQQAPAAPQYAQQAPPPNAAVLFGNNFSMQVDTPQNVVSYTFPNQRDHNEFYTGNDDEAAEKAAEWLNQPLQ